ncbi:MAG: hypothetical protein ACREDU_06150 [Methylocella sp.]
MNIPSGAQAFEIAERGPMPLFLADIRVHRARLFGLTPAGRNQAYPWDSPRQDLAEARRLIEKHGYYRRQPELEDALRSAGILPANHRRILLGRNAGRMPALQRPVPRYIVVKQPNQRKQLLFEHFSDGQLLWYGMPPDWLADVRNADEDSIREIAVHLPGKAAEALLD